MILITSYYTTLNKERQDEIDKCLIINNNNKFIEKIYLLGNEYFDLSFIENKQKDKIEQIIISNEKKYRLRYDDCIKFINNKLKNKICILSNSDIYFDETLSLINKERMENKLYALLRYDEIDNNKIIFTRFNLPRNDSQDCWIFKSPLNVNIDKLNFEFGTLGCDSILAGILYDNNINISNPSLDIITTHVHLTEYRTYTVDNRLYGKYCLIEAGHLEDESKISFMNYL